MNDSINFAQKYLEDMLSFFGQNVAVHATHNDEVIELSVPSTSINPHLIGHHGDGIRAFQSIIAAALRTGEYEVTRVTVDIADYKKKRYAKIEEEVEQWVKKVRESGEEMQLRQLNAAERRVVHQAASDYSDVSSESRGQGRDRRLYLIPAQTDEPAS